MEIFRKERIYMIRDFAFDRRRGTGLEDGVSYGKGGGIDCSAPAVVLAGTHPFYTVGNHGRIQLFQGF